MQVNNELMTSKHQGRSQRDFFADTARVSKFHRKEAQSCGNLLSDADISEIVWQYSCMQDITEVEYLGYYRS